MNWGIQIIHSKTNYPKIIIFWTGINPSRRINAIKKIIYIEPKDSEELLKQNLVGNMSTLKS